MTSHASPAAPARGHAGTPARAAAALLLALAALACAQGKDESAAASGGESAATTAEAPAVPAPAPLDSTTPSPVSPTGAEKVETRATTSPSEAKRLDEATRVGARQGAATRDTARSGAVTPPPVVRKTAAPTTTKSAATATTKTGAATTPVERPAADSTPPRATATTTPAPTQPAATPATGGAQTASAQDDRLTASPAAYQGWKTFHVYCYRCHGTDAMGSDLAPNLRHSVGPQGSVNHDVFVTTVKEGRLAKGMPAWKEVLRDDQIENLWAYLRARSDGSLAAGRPRQGKSD